MDKKSIKSKSSTRKNTVIIIRVTASAKLWLQEEGFSPTVIFNQALKELGCPDE